jgi:hypothetical protein
VKVLADSLSKYTVMASNPLYTIRSISIPWIDHYKVQQLPFLPIRLAKWYRHWPHPLKGMPLTSSQWFVQSFTTSNFDKF